MNPRADRRRQARRHARQLNAWAGLALGSLLLAGLFSFLLLLGRTPPFSELLPYPSFFRRCLVVHVDLALVVWFYAAIAGLLQFLPVRRGFELVDRWAPLIGAGGVAAMVATIFVPSAEPVLSDYVPVLDAPSFLAGLALFGVGISSVVASRGPLLATDSTEQGPADERWPAAFRVGLWTAAAALALAIATIVAAWATTPSDIGTTAYYERVFWGGGHVLQVASVSAMAAIWIALGSSFLDRPAVGRATAVGLFAWLLIPHLASPLLAIQGTGTRIYRSGATRLMEFGIFPPVLVLVLLLGVEFGRSAGEQRVGGWLDVRVAGLLASAALTLVGFAVGAMIRGSSTMVPAHYHASIGAVTVALMTFGLYLLEVRGRGFAHPGLRRYVPWQPLLFGFGQFVFVCGFAVAGTNGMGRKLFGSDQVVLSWGDYAGLVVMGAGGLAAIAGGLLFLVLVADRWLLDCSARDLPLDRSSATPRPGE